MRIEPEIAGVSLVMLGHFNPVIFTPTWFGWNELLPEKTVNIAGTKIVHPEISVFEADWLNLHVQPESFQINTTQPPLCSPAGLGYPNFPRKPSSYPP